MRSVIVFETVMRPSLPPELRCFTTIGTSLSATASSSSIRKPRSAGMCSKTMSITWCSTSSTGRTAISVSATWVSTFRMRFDFSISWTSGALRASGAVLEGPEPVSSRDSSPTERMMVPASSERGLPSSSTTLLSSALPKVSSNFPSVMRSPSLSGASTTCTPFTWVPFLDLRSMIRASPLSPTSTLAWLREMPKSRRTIWQSGERPITTSPEAKVKLCGVSPSW